MRWNVKSLFPENEKKYQEKEKSLHVTVYKYNNWKKIDKKTTIFRQYV